MLFTIISLLALAAMAAALLSTQSTLRYASQILLTGRDNSEPVAQPPADVAALDYCVLVQEAIGGAPMTWHNEVELLNDGPETFAAMLDAIDKARNHINLQSYILTSDTLGRRFAEALCLKAAAGVQVNLLYDAVGSVAIDKSFLQRLRDSGVHVQAFAAATDIRFWRFNQRDHRKILVVDGRIGFIGGINISDDYLDATDGAGSSGRTKGWRDIHTRVQGPIVAELQRLFLQTWLNTGCRTNVKVRYFPETQLVGSTCAALVAADRLDVESRILDSHIAAVQMSTNYVWITQAYFVPHVEFIQALIDAARRDVDVRILLPSFTDSSLLLCAARAHYEPLLKNGVKLYEYQPRLLHAKAAVVDGIWATVGSSNIDMRSLELNNEANLVVVDQSFAKKMQQLFENDQAQSELIDLAQWSKRGIWQRTKERFSLIFKYWL